jgi:hypothetical protein
LYPRSCGSVLRANASFDSLDRVRFKVRWLVWGLSIRGGWESPQEQWFRAFSPRDHSPAPIPALRAGLVWFTAVGRDQQQRRTRRRARRNLTAASGGPPNLPALRALFGVAPRRRACGTPAEKKLRPFCLKMAGALPSGPPASRAMNPSQMGMLMCTGSLSAIRPLRERRANSQQSVAPSQNYHRLLPNRSSSRAHDRWSKYTSRNRRQRPGAHDRELVALTSKGRWRFLR